MAAVGSCAVISGDQSGDLINGLTGQGRPSTRLGTSRAFARPLIGPGRSRVSPSVALGRRGRRTVRPSSHGLRPRVPIMAADDQAAGGLPESRPGPQQGSRVLIIETAVDRYAC
jgi:hypothetical protein